MVEDSGLPYSLELDATVRDLSRIRRFVEDTCLALDVAQGDIPLLLLAVDEVVSNVVVHGYRGSAGPVQVAIGRDAQGLIVRVQDGAPAFDPTGAAAPDLSIPLHEREPGGLGIHLLRKIMDEIAWRHIPSNGNELIMRKYLA